MTNGNLDEVISQLDNVNNQLVNFNGRFNNLQGEIINLDQSLSQLRGQLDTSSFFERYNWIITPFIAVVLFVIGYILKDSVDLLLKEQQLKLNSTQVVQNQIQKLSTSLSTEDKTAIAIGVAEFGEISIAPLVRQLRIRNEDLSAAVMEGLKAVAMVERSTTCSELEEVISEDERHYYPVWTHQRAVALLGELRCTDSIGILNEYKLILPAPFGKGKHEDYLKKVQNDGKIPESDIKGIGIAVEEAIKKLLGLKK